jgi:protein disulfide-isomerase
VAYFTKLHSSLPDQTRTEISGSVGLEITVPVELASENKMNFYCILPATVLAMAAFAGTSSSIAQTVPEPDRIYWVDSDRQAVALAQQFNLPILVYVTSDHCGFCRKMESEVWSNPDIVSMVESEFVPLKLNAQRDAATIAELKIRVFPTTLVFSAEAQFAGGAAGYLPPDRLAGLLRSGKRSQLVSHQNRPE